jgi:NTE family protein
MGFDRSPRATSDATARRAVVLGGGGVTGVAWATGLVVGLADAGVDLRDADLVIGTSAGSVVGAQITSGIALEALYDAQLSPRSTEIAARMSLGAIARLVAAAAWPGKRERGRAWLGRAALRAATISAARRREVIAQRLPHDTWPTTALQITAVDAESGAEVTFDATSGVSLVDAVAASCAVPTVWPPVPIGDRRYLDGGVRSPANVDLARGCGRVVVVAPIATAVRRGDRPAAQAAALGATTRWVVVSPDRAARAAIGRNVLDPARRAPAARAGRAQAAAEAARVRAVWTG